MLMDSIKMVTGAGVYESDGTTKYVGAAVYDIAGSTLSQPTDGAVLMRFEVIRDFTVPSAFIGSVAESTVAPTGSPVYTIQRNGANIGTITYTGNNGAFADDTELTAHAFISGDRLWSFIHDI